MGMSPYDLEQRIIAIEGRLGRLEKELQDKVGKSLLDMHTMYQEQSDALDQMTLLVGKLIQEVFPQKGESTAPKLT
jgi:hypothetical protein